MTETTKQDAPTPRPVPEWHRHRYGDGATLKTGAGEINVQCKIGSRGDPRMYYATVFGHRLKAEKANRDEMKSYALATAKRWATLALADIEAFEKTK